jgi:hypothetical protein
MHIFGGYWEVLDIGPHRTHYQFSCICLEIEGCLRVRYWPRVCENYLTASNFGMAMRELMD